MLRLGIVGTGTMGSAYARAVAEGSLAHLAILSAVCDPDLPRAAALAAETGVRAFRSVRELLDQAELDAVYIATPDDLHRDPFMSAVAAGTAVLVEKPFATTVDDALAMRAAAERHRVVAAVNFSNRWNPPFRRAKAVIEAGEIGDVLAFNCSLSNCLRSPVESLSWAGRSTAGWFLLSHCFDLARWLGGRRAVSVVANGTRRKLRSLGVDTYDYVHALVRYDDGTDGLFEASWVLPDELPAGVSFRFEITGTDGWISVDTTGQMITVASRRSGYRFLPTLQWTAERFGDFAGRVASGDRGLGEVDSGVANTRLLVALHRALSDGGLVEVGE